MSWPMAGSSCRAAPPTCAHPRKSKTPTWAHEAKDFAMDIFLQQLLNALSLGGTYALLALGLAVVFSIIGLINFAHGELMTVTGYAICFALIWGLPFPLAVMAGLAVAVVAALLMERIAFRPVRGASGTTLLLTSFA